MSEGLRVSTAKLLLRRTGKLFHRKHQRLAFQRIYAHSLLVALERKFASSSSSSVSLPLSSCTSVPPQTPQTPQPAQQPTLLSANSMAGPRGIEQ